MYTIEMTWESKSYGPKGRQCRILDFILRAKQHSVIRPFTPEDTDAFFVLMSDREINTFLPWFPLQTREEAEQFLEERYLSRSEEPDGFHYAICLKTDNIPIGYINVDAGESHDFGYALRRDCQHKGIMTEAALAVLEEIRKAGIPYITATHDVKNPASGNVMKRMGMTYRYSYEEPWQLKNILVTFRMYQLNLDGRKDRVYMEYWNRYPVHYIEKDV